MIGFDARYCDGRTSATREVRVEIDARRRVHVSGDGVDLDFEPGEVRVSARLGATPRHLYLPQGGRCESDDHEAIDAAFADGGGLVHALERRWAFAGAAALLTAVFLWAGFAYGLPVLARHTAHAVPPAMEAQMGAQSLAALDQHFLEPSALGDAGRERVHAAFRDVVSSLDPAVPARLELRRSEKLGANAFALPAGIVVVTDEMAELAGTDEQLAAVIAHELGHVHHRHVMRSILQSSATALLIAGLLGDVTSVTGLAASIPTFLVEQHYSRDFEYEADAFALEWMRSRGIDEAHFAAILERLDTSAGAGADGLGRYLSTHPSMRDRIDAIRR